jgi:SecD/SecF fusion protein
MKALTWKVLICLAPIVLGVAVVANAFDKYQKGEGGFNLGTDLVGGTILVYEVDQSRWPDGVVPSDYSVEKLTAKLKQRIDPADLYNVRITPLSKTRIEIVLPTGGVKYAERQEREWANLIRQVEEKWPPKEKDSGVYNVPIDQRQQLIDAVLKEHAGDPNVKAEDVVQFVDDHLPGKGEKRRGMTGEKVQEIKELISRVGSLKFVIVANTRDDQQAIEVAKAYFADAASDPTKQEALKLAAATGKPPPPPRPPDGKYFDTQLGRYNYVWIELGKSQRIQLHLDNASENDTRPTVDKSGHATGQMNNTMWQALAKAREKQEALEWGGNLYFSRAVQNPDRLPEADRGKKYEYFVLTRDSGLDDQGHPIPPLTGEFLINAARQNDDRYGIVVSFQFNSEGGRLLSDLTTKNVQRQMAIVLDDQVQSAPNIHTPLTGGGGIIYGNYTAEEVDRMVTMLRSGALPATLKPTPVSENTMGATLGADTIYWGTVSVLVAFVAILAFMLVYYRFAGVVACIALFANLILTVALMVLINATFTLPGLAGLVLMLGMAVDANVLIYERLREERDRGASLALAIRNGYDRAFPVIIDTHLSSICTAVVLYVVGNDQLKGFGISLTLGLIISLFTSLFMTRLLFDLWLAKGWLHKLSMMRLLSKPNIDFMAIRYYWFTATIILTILGASVFFWRLDRGGLNIDFTGGTAYTGLLNQPLSIEELRKDLNVDDAANKAKLDVADVKQLDDKGFDFEVTYKGDERPYLVQMPSAATPNEVRARAQDLPDLSLVQIFATGYSGEGKSRLFTVRTQERAADLVRAAVGRLLGDKLEQIKMEEPQVAEDGRSATLKFSDFTSPAQVSMLLTRQFEHTPELSNVAGQFTLERVGQDKEGRFKEMRLLLTAPGAVDRDKVKQALEAVRDQLATRPQPERLENFDSQLAADTQLRALYAILASWGIILLYLWWRFGSWTFGLAAVLCLIHDLFFTLGFIGISHYIHQWWPNNWLGIQDFKIDLNSVAALLTLVGYSVNDTIVVFDRIREVRGKNPELTPKMINDSVNQTLSRTLLTALSVWLVVIVLYALGGEGVHLFAFVMVIGVIVGTYSSIYIASPLLLIFGEGKPAAAVQRQPARQPAQA